MASFCGFVEYQNLKDYKENIESVVISIITFLLLKAHANKLGDI